MHRASSRQSFVYKERISRYFQISDVRNMLSHMQLDDNQHLDDQQVLDIFDALDAFVSCLETLQPQFFPQQMAANIKSQLIKVNLVSKLFPSERYKQRMIL